MAGLLVELGDRVEEREARARGTFGVVVMRGRPTEIGHYAVAEILGDVAIKAGNRLGGRAMVARDRIAPFLRIELS